MKRERLNEINLFWRCGYAEICYNGSRGFVTRVRNKLSKGVAWHLSRDSDYFSATTCLGSLPVSDFVNFWLPKLSKVYDFEFYMSSELEDGPYPYFRPPFNTFNRVVTVQRGAI